MEVERMKPEKVRREESLDEIFETLKSLSKRHLRIVRDVIGVLAETTSSDDEKTRLKRPTRKSLLKTPFCGMWKGRTEITDGRSYARILRQRLECRGDSI